MINPERMLGTLISGIIGGSSKSRKSSNVASSMVSHLASGKGLMTLVGLGVGAYSVLTDSEKTASANATPPPITQSSGNRKNVEISRTPPPLPGGAINDIQKSASSKELDPKIIAEKMIQVMIAAAHADGTIDEKEQAKIIEKIEKHGLNIEEKEYLVQQLEEPKTISEITAGINDQATAQMMYTMAIITIDIDSEEERYFCDELAKALRLDPAQQKIIESL